MDIERLRIERLRKDLIRDEGLKLFPYRCTAGRLTIGVGRNLDDKGITTAEAMNLLDNDITERRAALALRVPGWYELPGAVQEVLINMSFMGIEKLLQFKKMFAAIKRGEWNAAADELLDSKYAKDVGARADRLSARLRELK